MMLVPTPTVLSHSIVPYCATLRSLVFAAFNLLFGKAMLRGMGWKEGEGINGKAEVVPVEYVPRPQLLGLSATPAAEAGGGGKGKKFIKPGESREPKKDMIYIDKETGKQ